jgi:hypothetical protein
MRVEMALFAEELIVKTPNVQGGIDLKSIVVRTLLKHMPWVEKLKEKAGEIYLACLNVLETIPLLLQMMRGCRVKSDIVLVFVAAYKMLTGHSIAEFMFDFGAWFSDTLLEMTTGAKSGVKHWTHTPFVQSKPYGEEQEEDKTTFEWILEAARMLLDKGASLKSCAAMKKMQTLLCYFFSFGLMKKFNIPSSFLTLKNLSLKAVKTSYDSTVGFVFTVIETIVWFLERGVQAVKLKSFDPFLHSSKSYSKWIDRANRIREDSQKLQNPEAVGIDIHAFMHELKSLIESGESMVRWATNKDDKAIVAHLLSELRLINARIATKDNAQKQRRAPLAVLVAGDSSVGKSQFQQILIHQYATLCRKPEGDEYVYTRCSADKYWSGFSTHKWAIILDDIAMMSTSLGLMDPSMADMLQIINNVPFTPPMADLIDKGNCPVRPDLVVASTNQVNINAHAYFSCPLAVRRRFPYVIELEPRAEFCVAGSKMLDGSKVPPPDGAHYMDVWHIKVSQLIAVPAGGRANPELEEKYKFDKVVDFLVWFNSMILEHHRTQDKCDATTKLMHSVPMCDSCYLPRADCTCVVPFVGADPDDVVNPTEESVVQSGSSSGEEDAIPVSRRHRPVDGDVPTPPGTPRRTSGPIYYRFYSESEEMEAWRASLAGLHDHDDEDTLSQVSSISDSVFRTQPRFTTRALDFIDDTWTHVHVCARMMAAGLGHCCAKAMEKVLLTASDYMIYYQVDRLKKKFVAMGQKVQSFLSDWRVQAVCIALLAAWPVYKGISMLAEFLKPSAEVQSEGVVPTFFAKDAKPNVWAKDEFRLSTFQTGDTTEGWQRHGFGSAVKKIQNNVVRLLNVYRGDDGEMKSIPCNALCIVGHVYMTDAHCMPKCDFECNMLSEPHSTFVNSNMKFPVQVSRVYFDRLHDLAYFACPYPPRADLTGLLLKRDCSELVLNGSYVGRATNGFPFEKKAQRIRATDWSVPEPIGRKMPSWHCHVDEATEFGQCGMPLIGETKRGPVILGLHQTGISDIATSIRIDLTYVAEALTHFDTQIQSGFPMLDVQPGPLHQKSVLRWEHEGQAKIYGSTKGFRAAPKSRVEPTLISEAAQEQGFVKRCGRPAMDGPIPWHRGCTETINQEFLIDEARLEECVQGYVNDVCSGLDKEALSELVVLDYKTTVNGFPGVKYLDKMNRSTSMGYPYRKSKEQFLLPLEPDDIWQDAVKFTPEIEAEIARIERCYEERKRAVPVFVASLKDEALPFKKIDIKKTRVFLGASAPWSCVVRKYLLSFVRQFQLHPTLFEGCPGLNCACDKWGELYEYLTQHGLMKLIAGDFRVFDKKMCCLLILAAFRAIRLIHERAGWAQGDLDVISGIAEDIAYPLVDFQGDLIEFFGSNPSGQPLTVIINCIANSLYMRYAYSCRNPAKTGCVEFKKNVALGTYGDDNAQGVSDNVPWYTHTAIREELAQIGVDYTMAEKERESVPYISMDEVTFLKRRWVWDDEVEAWLCPLEWASIEKMLTIGIASQAICAEEQAADTICSAMNEFFHYGRKIYDENMKKMKLIVQQCSIEKYVDDTCFVSFDERCIKYWANCYDHPKKDRSTSFVARTGKNIESVECELQSGESELDLTAAPCVPELHALAIFIAILREESRQPVAGNGFTPATYEQTTQSHDYLECAWCFPATHPVLKRENCQLQSGEEAMPLIEAEAAPLPVDQHETVQFVDAPLTETDGRVTDFEPTYSEHTDEIATLGKFLERPVLIDQFTWNEADNFTLSPHTILPWYLYFNNVYIKSKLQNFSRLHCSLKLTFRYNASPFYYGAMRVSYDPLSTGKFDPVAVQDIIPLSQTPGVFLEPQVGSSAELILPFIWPHSWLDTAVAASFNQMGKIIFDPFVSLRSANGVTGSGITISTYAEACNVEISGPTVQTLLQSGIVSGPASAIASFASKFSSVYAIGPYARAIDIGASAVSRIAKIFGFSNAPVMQDVVPMQNKVFHAFANTETSMPIDKLALDPANEVTIDNRVAGDVGEDPLIIRSLVTKPAVVGIVNWASSVAANTIIQYGVVSPFIVQSSAGTSQTYKFYTPSGWMCEMFRFWRGGMRYTFRVERSAYHKGRLIVCWDPNGVVSALGVETAVFSKIFDLSSPEQEFTVDVPYKACSPWLTTGPTSCLSAGVPSVDKGSFNGYLTLGVLNPLTGPLATTSVDVMISVSALEDMEFAAPDGLPNTVTTAPIQSGECSVLQSGELLDEGTLEYSERIPDITVGERVGSLRVMLHRASRGLTQYLGINGTAATVYTVGSFHTVNYFDRLPPVYGFQTADGYNSATAVVGSGTKRCNFCPTHPLNWVLSAFLGYRGSVVVHANVSGDANSKTIWNMSLTRTNDDYSNVSTSTTVRNCTYEEFDLSTGPASLTAIAMLSNTGSYNYWPTGQGGTTVTNGKTQMAMSAVVPQYCRARFMPAAFSQRNNDFVNTIYDTVRLDTDLSLPVGDTTTPVWPHVDVYWAAGVDFNPVFFTGVPHMYNYAPPVQVVA